MKNDNIHPPKLFLRFFNWFCHPELKKYIEGDLMELYEERIRKYGKTKADWKFRMDILLLCRPGIIRPTEEHEQSNHYDMIKSYFKITWRSLLKNKGYSFINIVGLATGMTVAILIGLWISDERSFNSYFKNHKQLAQVMLNQSNEGTTYTGPTIATPVADPLKTKYADDFKEVCLISWEDRYIVSLGDNRLSTSGLWVEDVFPKMFTLKIISGSRGALKDPSSVLISQSLAKSLFNSTDALNKSIRINNDLDMIVGGVYEDMPHNTTFADAKLLLPWQNPDFWMNKNTDWGNHSCRLFVQLSEQSDIKQVSEKVKGLPTPFIKQYKEEIMLYPLDKLRLYSEFTNGEVSGGRIQYVWLIGLIGVFVLLLACINFMNLSTARSEKRSKEVGIRKTIGSARGQLIGQFLTESIVIAFTALVLSIIFVQLALPSFNSIADKQISIQWGNPIFWVSIIGFALFSGIISGSYPAFYLSSFNPVKVLKGTFKASRFSSLPRKVLVVVQFTVSVTLIIGTIIIFQQIQYAKDRPVGYSQSGLISVDINTPDLQGHYDAIRNDLFQTGVVENMAESSQRLTQFNNNNSLDWPGKDPALQVFFRNVNITPDFGKTIDWKIVSGRDFSKEITSDSSGIILNEEAARIVNLKNPIGEVVKYRDKDYTIIGIAADMVTQSPYEPIEPAMFFMGKYLGVITLRIKPDAPIHAAISAIEAVFKKYNPNSPFEYLFVDEEFGWKFSDEERIGNLASLFAILAIFISCLGLFGLASFVAEQRTKEIGIRKVMGASVASVWQMLSKDFITLVFISCLIAIPIASYGLNEWLNHYQYHTEISAWIFLTTGLGALIITLLTVSFQAVKAAISNPVKSLRSE